MIKRIFLVFLIQFLFISISSRVEAKEIKVAVGFAVAPYIIADTQSGIELDIIREALEYKGYSMKTIHVPFIEIDRAIIDKGADAIATVEEKIGIDGHFSDHVITYTNYAISLASKNLTINSIDDLIDKKVTSFQLSTKYLGHKFAEMAEANPRFREKEKHTLSIKVLFNEQSDVAIMDKNIFLYYSKDVKDEADTTKPVIYHDIFPANEYKVVFKDKDVRDDFNEGLKHLKDSGRYQQIYNKYLK
ncbi:MAG: transporter substrate-binding domain-containing protein [Rickettsiales bacterium]|nr:transporter substrate-binding domain-containing protein [Pseudomonadota bacterium]MDA0967082.1 transporter substrate-binding domain-containing protein [Pseudomonadota bacterium]MDG4542432.1 transporter substrate-binding domain-containing protein [Rickettsiales bacterium]MDG4544936.1 transporter substrate-binding domain-containing protein [Rickettsiales bacterium]MDG4547059.1 transporter substrate-binding domain-containing protein [Rickettsiales bacterium]